MILRRLPESRFSEVMPEWRGMTVAVLAGGPSLTREQIAVVAQARAADRVRVIAVNDAYLLAPWADVHYAADSHWHRWQTEGIPKPTLDLTAEDVRKRWAAFRGQKCTIQNSGANVTDPAVHRLRNRDFPRHGSGLSLDPQALATGSNSGFQAMNVATLAGAATLLLLGFDAREPAPGAPAHGLCGDHPRPTPIDVYPGYRASMAAAAAPLAAAGVRVLNCSKESAITAFPKIDVEEALCEVITA